LTIRVSASAGPRARAPEADDFHEVKIMRPSAHYTFAAVLAAFSAGCGPGLTLVPMSGVVTLDGSPLEGATVAFVPNTPNPDGESSFGVSGPDGRYEIATAGSRGVVPGKYQVTVVKIDVNTALLPEEYQEFKDDLPMLAQLFPPETKKGRRRPPKSLPPMVKIEGAFAHDVPPAGGTFDLDVKSKPAAKAAKSARTPR